MITRHIAAVAALTLCSGIAGGMIATLPDLNALAQSDRPLNGDAVRITDRQGRVRAGLGVSGGNQEFTYLYLLDRNGTERVSFRVSDTAPPDVLLGTSPGRGEGPVRAEPPREVAQGACGPATFSQLRGRVRGKLQGAAGDKADNLQELTPPRGVLAQDMNTWLSTLNDGLLTIVRARFSQPEMRQFRDEEGRQCNKNIYCELAFRRNSIAILSGLRP